MIPELTALGAVVVMGVGIGVPAYVRLFRILRERHPAIDKELGHPNMLMGSPSRSNRLQKFIYSARAVGTGDDELTSAVRFLRVFAPSLIIAVFVAIGFMFRAALVLISQGIPQ